MRKQAKKALDRLVHRYEMQPLGRRVEPRRINQNETLDYVAFIFQMPCDLQGKQSAKRVTHDTERALGL